MFLTSHQLCLKGMFYLTEKEIPEKIETKFTKYEEIGLVLNNTTDRTTSIQQKLLSPIYDFFFSIYLLSCTSVSPHVVSVSLSKVPFETFTI